MVYLKKREFFVWRRSVLIEGFTCGRLSMVSYFVFGARSTTTRRKLRHRGVIPLSNLDL